MRRLPHLALAAVLLALVAGCETPPDHDQQASIIQADVQQTFDGDMGALIYHGYEAARLAQAADAARGELASLPSYSPANINISNRANEMADQATEERRQAEAALNRLLDPLRDRIAKLEQEQGGKPQTAAAVTAVLQFAPGSALIPAREQAKLQAITQYLAQPSPGRGRDHRLVRYRRQQPGRQRPVARPGQCGLCGPDQPRPAGRDERRHPRRRTPGRRRRRPSGRDPGPPGRLGPVHLLLQGICSHSGLISDGHPMEPGRPLDLFLQGIYRGPRAGTTSIRKLWLSGCGLQASLFQPSWSAKADHPRVWLPQVAHFRG